ncbi:MAG: 1-(5-phosphoribosyl)-5-amino-4-imidazole-carboxylate carboxylase, partial [Deltaproteobacteria bacterium]|nr:1-(5-phosphoribosyl)-5-amino-4-imidazole-carboxylate carboxylase [Deltaproteobacteria bacterium]
MNKESLHKILQSVATGKTSVDNAAKALTNISFENIGFAHIDHNRSLRKGFPEVVFGEGKTAEQVIRIVEKIIEEEDLVLVTRVSQDKAEKIKSHLPD